MARASHNGIVETIKVADIQMGVDLQGIGGNGMRAVSFLLLVLGGGYL